MSRRFPVFLSTTLLALLFLSVVTGVTPALADTMYLENGETVDDCKVTEVIGEHISFRCDGNIKGTLTRNKLKTRHDKVLLTTGAIMSGEVLYFSDHTLEMATSTGLQRVRQRLLKEVTLGLEDPVTPQRVPVQNTGVLEKVLDAFQLAAPEENHP